MPKIDLKRENKEFYNSSTKEVSIVDVPEMNFFNDRWSRRPKHVTRISICDGIIVSSILQGEIYK